MSTKNIFVAIFIFFCGFISEFVLSAIAYHKHTQNLLKKPGEEPDYDYFFDEEDL